MKNQKKSKFSCFVVWLSWVILGTSLFLCCKKAWQIYDTYLRENTEVCSEEVPSQFGTFGKEEFMVDSSLQRGADGDDDGGTGGGYIVAEEANEDGKETSLSLKQAEPFSLFFWNVKNFVLNQKEKKEYYRIFSPKKEDEQEAVAKVIAVQSPDIVVLAEIGGWSELENLRDRIAQKGVNYPYLFCVHGDGSLQGLGVLSRGELVENKSEKYVDLPGEPAACLTRSILDIGVLLPSGGKIRVVGIHLKSKFKGKMSSEVLRHREALYVAKRICRENASLGDVPIVLCGDFNDTKNSPSLCSMKEILRLINMKPLLIKDSFGEVWTHFYAQEGVYSCIDYIWSTPLYAGSSQLKLRGKILDSGDVKKGSDHRPLFLSVEKK